MPTVTRGLNPRSAEPPSNWSVGWIVASVRALTVKTLMITTPTHTLYLENTPVIEVQNLFRDTDRKFTTDALIADTEYAVYEDRVELALSYGYYGYGYGYGYGNHNGRRLISSLLKTIRVEYVAGWASVQIPFDRQRIDLREESGGNTLNFTLAAGVYTPAELVSTLQIELNTAGDNTRTVSFDWKTRTFKITQEDGDLTLITSETNVFADTDSALPLLGFLDANTYDSSPATGDTVTLDIPKRFAKRGIGFNCQ